MDKEEVFALIVTYGNRFEYLKTVVEKLTALGVGGVVVVDNDSTKESQEKLTHLSKRIDILNIIHLEYNTGSAQGFSTGLKSLIQIEECKKIWLLDDDNLPNDNALNSLMKKWSLIDAKSDIKCLLSLRPARQEYVNVAKNQKGYLFPSSNCFLGFSIFEKLKLIKTYSDKFKSGNILMEVPYAPYGGMFFEKAILDDIGLPDNSFFLYSDDHEFSYRITKTGGKIILVPDSIIDDIDESWYLKSKEKRINKLLKSSKFRVYYYVRNRVFFERKDLITKRMIYYLNMMIYLFLLFVFSLKNKGNFFVLLCAVRDGFRGRLGRNKKFE